MPDHTVIGLPKCGTSSLQRYLKNKFDTGNKFVPVSQITKIESIYDPNARMVYNSFHNGSQVHVICRDMAERLWSGFHYFKYYKRMPFEVFLENEDITRQNLGFNQPLAMCDWTPFLGPFMDLRPKIHFLDKILEEEAEEFPRVKIQKETSEYYPDLPDETRFIVHELLKGKSLDKYGIPFNWDYLTNSVEDDLEFDWE